MESTRAMFLVSCFAGFCGECSIELCFNVFYYVLNYDRYFELFAFAANYLLNYDLLNLTNLSNYASII